MLAIHAIFAAHGFWLPNDPRGSWSQFVGRWELFKYGKATKVDTRRSVAHIPHDSTLRKSSKTAMKYPPVRFTGAQAACIGRGFSTAISASGYQLLACSILPEHVHLVITRHARPTRQIVGHLKTFASRQLRKEGLHPTDAPSVWARGCWTVYLNSGADVRRAILYVEQNPLKEKKRIQRWSFVTPFAT
jgi:REP-associated tyrosine transposase